MRVVTLSPSRPASGRSLTEKVMESVGGSTGLALIGWITSRIADRVGDRGLLEPGDGDDVAGLGALDRQPLEAAEGEQLGEPRMLDHPAVRARWPSPAC